MVVVKIVVFLSNFHMMTQQLRVPPDEKRCIICKEKTVSLQ